MFSEFILVLEALRCYLHERNDTKLSSDENSNDNNSSVANYRPFKIDLKEVTLSFQIVGDLEIHARLETRLFVPNQEYEYHLFFGHIIGESLMMIL